MNSSLYDCVFKIAKAAQRVVLLFRNENCLYDTNMDAVKFRTFEVY